MLNLKNILIKEMRYEFEHYWPSSGILDDIIVGLRRVLFSTWFYEVGKEMNEFPLLNYLKEHPEIRRYQNRVLESEFGNGITLYRKLSWHKQH